MKKLSAVLVAVGMGLIMAQGAFAVPTYNAATDHWYDTVSGGQTGNWYTAEAAAVTLGGHLVTINDAAEETWLKNTFGTSLYWIGFTDSAIEGTWQWVSGEAVTYTNWSGGEPNNFGGEDWATMNWGSGWNDLAPGTSAEGYPWGLYRGIAEWKTSSVPEPGTLLLLGSGLAGLAAFRKRFALK